MTDIPFFFDVDPVVRVQQLLGLGWPLPWELVSLLGSTWGILLVVGLALWLWGRGAAYGVLAVVVVDGVLKTALNWLFHVPRPDGAELVKYERVDVGSFPSGHVSTATGLWGYLAYRGLIPWTLAIVVVVLESISRLYLGVHFIGDVLGGILLGAIAIGLVGRLWPPVRGWLARRSFGFFVGAAAVVVAGVLAGAFFYFGDNPYRWRAGGMVAGLAIALPLEYRFVRYQPDNVGAGTRVLMVVIGVAGIAAMAAIDQYSGQRSNSLGLAATGLAALWATLVAPTIFAKLGWTARGEPRRETTVNRVAGALGAATIVLVGVTAYGIGVEPRLILDIEEHPAAIPNLPPAWSGATVAVVSDFQLGLWLDNTGMMRRAVARIVEREPDVALLAGDFIYDPNPDPNIRIRPVMDVLRPLVAAGIPTFAVLGNHDWGLPQPLGEAEPDREAARLLRDSLAAAGIRVLENRAQPIRRRGGGDPLYLVGLGSHYMEMDDASAALEGVPGEAARIVLMHNPSSFEQLPARSAPLAVAGHTHGGQARLPFTPDWSWLTFTRAGEVHADGWIERDYGEAGNRLYVTRGIGMSVIPMRLNCPPELTVFTLEPESG